MSIVLVKQAVVSKLNDMQSLKAVFNYETTNSSGYYPFATVTLAGGTGEFASTVHTRRVRNFTIRVYQEKMEAGQGDQNAESIIASVIDEIETAFDADVTLSGICKFAMPIEWNSDYLDREHDTRILNITIQAIELPVVR